MSDIVQGFLLCLILDLFYEILGYLEHKRQAKKCNYVCENCKYFPCNKWDCERWKNKNKRKENIK